MLGTNIFGIIINIMNSLFRIFSVFCLVRQFLLHDWNEYTCINTQSKRYVPKEKNTIVSLKVFGEKKMMYSQFELKQNSAFQTKYSKNKIPQT